MNPKIDDELVMLKRIERILDKKHPDRKINIQLYRPVEDGDRFCFSHQTSNHIEVLYFATIKKLSDGELEEKIDKIVKKIFNRLKEVRSGNTTPKIKKTKPV